MRQTSKCRVAGEGEPPRGGNRNPLYDEVTAKIIAQSASDSLSYGAIAFRLGVSIGEVESALAGALSKLTEGLDEP